MGGPGRLGMPGRGRFSAGSHGRNRALKACRRDSPEARTKRGGRPTTLGCQAARRAPAERRERRRGSESASGVAGPGLAGMTKIAHPAVLRAANGRNRHAKESGHAPTRTGLRASRVCAQEQYPAFVRRETRDAASELPQDATQGESRLTFTRCVRGRRVAGFPRRAVRAAPWLTAGAWGWAAAVCAPRRGRTAGDITRQINPRAGAHVGNGPSRSSRVWQPRWGSARDRNGRKRDRWRCYLRHRKRNLGQGNAGGRGTRRARGRHHEAGHGRRSQDLESCKNSKYHSTPAA